MPGVFISYRREDSSGYAGRLFDILSARFGRENTFMDLDTIEGGDNFTAVIEQKLTLSDVLLAVIGSRWLTTAGENGTRRLDNKQDFVRLEIGRALERGIRVIPVLVGGAIMPRPEDLPDDLRPLCERQALEVRDAHFHPDAEQLAEVLHKALHGAGFHPAITNMTNRRRFLPALLTGIGLIVAALSILLFRRPKPDARAPFSPLKTEPKPARPAATADAKGKWKATVKYDWGDTYTELFDFEVYGSEISGTASLLGSGHGGDRGIFDGKIEGNRISFMTKSLSTLGSDDKTYEEKHFYRGIIEGGTIRFTMITDSSIESHAPIHFIATKVKAP